jgi:hypothetical protein
MKRTGRTVDKQLKLTPRWAANEMRWFGKLNGCRVWQPTLSIPRSIDGKVLIAVKACANGWAI